MKIIHLCSFFKITVLNVVGYLKEYCRGRDSLQDEEHAGQPRSTKYRGLVKAIKLEGPKTVTANGYTTKRLPEILQEVNVGD
ncbi:hypothetical protein TNCV_3292131 [Trichonephila clavipes]|nr:hypothetical protein TNCV_3292131 [Trichonephila clavipes]